MDDVDEVPASVGARHLAVSEQVQCGQKMLAHQGAAFAAIGFTAVVPVGKVK